MAESKPIIIYGVYYSSYRLAGHKLKMKVSHIEDLVERGSKNFVPVKRGKPLRVKYTDGTSECFPSLTACVTKLGISSGEIYRVLNGLRTPSIEDIVASVEYIKK